jgi:hypothetical protein
LIKREIKRENRKDKEGKRGKIKK